MRSAVQRELDRAEEYVLTALFGDVNKPVLSNKVKLFLIAKGIDFDTYINSKIDLFEEFSVDFMSEDGYYIGDKLAKALTTQYPMLEGVNIPNIKPIDLFKALNHFVGIEAIGKIIQTI